MFPHLFKYFSKSPSSQASDETESPVVFFEAPSSDFVDPDMRMDGPGEAHTAAFTAERPIIVVETRQARYFPFSLFTRSDALMSDLDLSSPTEDCANETIIREATKEEQEQEEADAQWEKSWDQGKGLLQGRYRKVNLAGSGTVEW